MYNMTSPTATGCTVAHADYSLQMWECRSCQQPANCFCYQCQRCLCASCHSNHSQVARYQSHVFVALLPGLFCSEHSTQPVVEFCSECDVGLCVLCLVEGAHAKHPVKELMKGMVGTQMVFQRHIQRHKAMVSVAEVDAIANNWKKSSKIVQEILQLTSNSLKSLIKVIGE